MGLKGFFWVAVRCRPATLKAMTYFIRSSGSLVSVVCHRKRKRDRLSEKSCTIVALRERDAADERTGGLAKEMGSKREAIGKTLEEGARLEQVYCSVPIATRARRGQQQKGEEKGAETLERLHHVQGGDDRTNQQKNSAHLAERSW
jgi:hypothetical protein